MKKSLLAVITSAILVSGQGQATDYPLGNVTFNGSVSGGTCTFTLSGQSTSGTTVTLPIVPVSSFTGLRSAAGRTSFSLNISGCENAVYNDNIQVVFHGTAESVQISDAFKNAASTNPATGIALRMIDGISLNPVTPNNAAAAAITLTNGAFNYPMAVEYLQSTTVAPTEGNVLVNSTVYISY